MEGMTSLSDIVLSAVLGFIKRDSAEVLLRDIASTSPILPPEGRAQKDRVLVVFNQSGLLTNEEYEKADDLAEDACIRDVWFVSRLAKGYGNDQLSQYFPGPGFRFLSGIMCYGECAGVSPLLLTRCIRSEMPMGRSNSAPEIPIRVVSVDTVEPEKAAQADGVYVRAGTMMNVPTMEDLVLMLKVASSLPAEGRKVYFMGDLAQFIENPEDFCDYDGLEITYSASSGFKLTRGCELRQPAWLLDFIKETDFAAVAVDKMYVVSWLSHVNGVFRQDAPLSRRSATMLPVYLPVIHVQATLGGLADRLTQLKSSAASLLSRFEAVDLFKLGAPDDVILSHEIKCTLEALGGGTFGQVPIPVGMLLRHLNSPLHDAFSCACELIDFIVQFHSMVAASLARQFSPCDSPLTRFFEEKTYTDLHAWLLEFQSARGSFEKQFAQISRGRSTTLSQLFEPGTIPCLATFFSEDVLDLLNSLRLIRNRNFAHSGNYSRSEKDEVVDEVSRICRQYIDKTGAAWSVINVGTIHSMNNGECHIKPLGASSGVIGLESYTLPPDCSCGAGDLVLGIRGCSRRTVMPVMPAFYLLPSGDPDCDQLYFLSSQESESKEDSIVYKFNCYTGAPRGELTFGQNAKEIERLLCSIKSMKESADRVPLIVSRDAFSGGYSFTLLSGGSLYPLNEAEIAGVLSSFINQHPLVLNKSRLVSIPVDDTPMPVDPENVFLPGASLVMEILLPRYEFGKPASVGLNQARFTNISILARFD